MKKVNNNSVEFVVLNCFVRVIKSDGKYMLYRRGVNNTGIMKFLIGSKKSYSSYSDSPFMNSTSTNDVVKVLEKITNDMAKSNGKKGGIKDLDRYEHVTMTINHLLHFFMEANGVSMDKLCSMGEEIYNLSCNKLFGDELEDLELQKEEATKNMDDMQLKAKVFQDYVRDMKEGKISQHVSFDEYFKNVTGGEINGPGDWGAQAIGRDMGQQLGSGPDGNNGFLGEAMRFERPAWLDEDD